LRCCLCWIIPVRQKLSYCLWLCVNGAIEPRSTLCHLTSLLCVIIRLKSVPYFPRQCYSQTQPSKKPTLYPKRLCPISFFSFFVTHIFPGAYNLIRVARISNRSCAQKP